MKANLRTFPHPLQSLLPRLNFPHKISAFSPQAAEGVKVWVLQSVHHTFPNISSCSLPLFKHGVSSSINLLTWILPMGCSSSQTVGFPLTGCSPSGTGCSITGPPWGHRSLQKTFSSVGYSSQLQSFIHLN